MKKINLSILLTFILSTPAWSQIYIHINQVASDSFPIAIAPLNPESKVSDPQNSGEKFATIVKNDLDLMGVFKFIGVESFLDKTTNDTAATIDFSKWAVLDALALVKGNYKFEKNLLVISAKLFDVLKKNELLAKKYQVAPDQISSAAHAFANEIVKVLTGEDSVFNTKIAYVCKPKGKKDICTMNFDGSDFKQLTSLKTYALSPNWDTFGKSVFFISPENQKNPAMFKADLSKRAIQKISALPGMVNGVSVDPKGRFLATSLSKDGNAEIYLLNMDGSIHKRLTINQDIDVSPKFSDDGSQLVFVSDRFKSPQIFKMDLEGKSVKQLTFKGKNNSTPAWSPRGDKILFSGMDTDGHCDIFSMDTDGSNLIRLTYDSKDNISPSWSPGGQMIVFSSNRAGKYQLYTMRPDGTKQRKITTESWDHEMPMWSPRLK